MARIRTPTASSARFGFGGLGGKWRFWDSGSACPASLLPVSEDLRRVAFFEDGLAISLCHLDFKPLHKSLFEVVHVVKILAPVSL